MRGGIGFIYESAGITESENSFWRRGGGCVLENSRIKKLSSDYEVWRKFL